MNRLGNLLRRNRLVDRTDLLAVQVDPFNVTRVQGPQGEWILSRGLNVEGFHDGYSIARGSPGFGSVASMSQAVEEDEKDTYHAEISSWGEEDIYLPVLKATSTECEKVWDAEILGCDETSKKVRLMRVR